WRKRYVEDRKLRTGAKMLSLLNRIPAELRSRVFVEIRRDDVAAMLDRIQDESGAAMADKTLTVVSSLMTWYAARHSRYTPPLVRGMRRTDPKKKERDRVLDDDELRAVWKAAEANGTFGALIRMLLLTSQRLDKILTMQWSDLSDDGVWTIPTA